MFVCFVLLLTIIIIDLCADHEGVYFLYLLSTLLSGRKASNMKLLYQFQVSAIIDNILLAIARLHMSNTYMHAAHPLNGMRDIIHKNRSFFLTHTRLCTQCTKQLFISVHYLEFGCVCHPFYYVYVYMYSIVL